MNEDPDKRPDLNLLYALAVVVEERSVAGAAQRLGLSNSAVSRQLARLRELTGDAILVRAGRDLVLTPHATELAQRTRRLVDEARLLLRPEGRLDFANLEHTFRIHSGEGFVETFGRRLLEHVSRQAPKVRLRFSAGPTDATQALRRGEVDLIVGVIRGASEGPELRKRVLLRDRFVGVVRPSHPLAQREITTEDYAKSRHVETTRHAPDKGLGPIDAALDTVGHTRNIETVVSGFTAALALVRSTDYIATVPERHTAATREGLHTFTLPFDTPEIPVCMLWHPRDQTNPAHQWLRQSVADSCSPPT